MKAQADGRILTALALMALAVGCGIGSTSSMGPQSGASELTSISISLPDRTGMKTQIPDIEAKMNGYHFIVSPVDPNCPGATKVNQLDVYKNISLLTSLKQGCDYDVTLALGNKGGAAAPQPASKPSYEGKIKSIIDTNCISCHKSGGTPPELTTYTLSKDKGDRILDRAVTKGNMPKSGLGQADKDLIKAWADGGYLEKDAASPSPSPQPSTGLSSTYYKNNAPLRVRKEDIAGKAEFKVTLALALQPDGRLIGLANVQPTPPVPPPAPAPLPPAPAPAPTPPAPPAPTPANIPSDRDFSFADSAGKSEKLSQHFRSQYMLLDFSSSSCGYCIQRAQEMNSDSDLQRQLDGSKCAHATIVPRGDLSAWKRRIGDSSFTGKHSYEATTGNISSLWGAFDVQSDGTPTFIVIDATGKVVSSLTDPNGIPSDTVAKYCQ